MRGKATKIVSVLSFLLILMMSTLSLAQEDVKGSRDHPIISRFPGSYIYQYYQKDFDEFNLLLGPVKYGWGKALEEVKKEKMEGKVTLIQYQIPKGKSSYEVFKNYEQALKEAGFQIMYLGRGEDIKGIKGFCSTYNRFRFYADTSDDPGGLFHITAKNSSGNIGLSISIMESDNPNDGPKVFLGIVEKEELKTGLITAENIAREIEKKGHIAIYGIYFDFDSAEVKPDSEPTLREMAKFLKENPGIEVYIVGHTDNAGSLEYNMELSRRRAEAVVRELTTKYGINKSRLAAYGVGPLSPVASNDSEEGRAKNRRVEMVKK